MIYWKNIIPGPDPPNLVYAIIECPKGTQKKYEISKTTNILMLDRILHSSVVYPQDYGFIPGTYADDDDPLDILVLINSPTTPCTIIESIPIGVLIMDDEKGLDEKILAVAANDPFYNSFNDIGELPAHYLNEIKEFFRTYKNLEDQKCSCVRDWEDKSHAKLLINECIKKFKEKFGDIAIIQP
ncbi:MAG: inorganic diphosphatase [Candidatus Lokiarchaeota archaeon]|nr:inorganic diphosphatase [Candidatus Lokiarchaeota archaeon]